MHQEKRIRQRQRNKKETKQKSLYVGREKGIQVASGVSVWDTYGMKTGIIFAKSWIQTPKEGYGNRFDEVLTFFLKGAGYVIICQNYCFWTDFSIISGDYNLAK